jgi:hypothetical protein
VTFLDKFTEFLRAQKPEIRERMRIATAEEQRRLQEIQETIDFLLLAAREAHV